jgi:tRNA (cytidine/uridine-2'-O-)-methyltransferase
MKANFNIVLTRPEIPQNTGNIGRLCVSTGTRLHLIKPLGFSLDDNYVKRAGLDYWQHLDLETYESWNDFAEKNKDAEFYFFSTKAEKLFWDCPYEKDSFLIFGNESSGLPIEFYDIYKDKMYKMPMQGKFCRSLNLANTAAIALFEGLRLFRERN